jgi:hypothetical protein
METQCVSRDSAEWLIWAAEVAEAAVAAVTAASDGGPSFMRKIKESLEVEKKNRQESEKEEEEGGGEPPLPVEMEDDEGGERRVDENAAPSSAQSTGLAMAAQVLLW